MSGCYLTRVRQAMRRNNLPLRYGALLQLWSPLGHHQHCCSGFQDDTAKVGQSEVRIIHSRNNFTSSYISPHLLKSEKSARPCKRQEKSASASELPVVFFNSSDEVSFISRPDMIRWSTVRACPVSSQSLSQEAVYDLPSTSSPSSSFLCFWDKTSRTPCTAIRIFCKTSFVACIWELEFIPSSVSVHRTGWIT